MFLAKDPSVGVRSKFLQVAVPALNEWLAPSEHSLVLDLIQIVDNSK